jgi:hypothetical protein
MELLPEEDHILGLLPLDTCHTISANVLLLNL